MGQSEEGRQEPSGLTRLREGGHQGTGPSREHSTEENHADANVTPRIQFQMHGAWRKMNIS